MATERAELIIINSEHCSCHCDPANEHTPLTLMSSPKNARVRMRVPHQIRAVNRYNLQALSVIARFSPGTKQNSVLIPLSFCRKRPTRKKPSQTRTESQLAVSALTGSCHVDGAAHAINTHDIWPKNIWPKKCMLWRGLWPQWMLPAHPLSWNDNADSQHQARYDLSL